MPIHCAKGRDSQNFCHRTITFLDARIRRFCSPLRRFQRSIARACDAVIIRQMTWYLSALARTCLMWWQCHVVQAFATILKHDLRYIPFFGAFDISVADCFLFLPFMNSDHLSIAKVILRFFNLLKILSAVILRCLYLTVCSFHRTKALEIQRRFHRKTALEQDFLKPFEMKIFDLRTSKTRASVKFFNLSTILFADLCTLFLSCKSSPQLLRTGTRANCCHLIKIFFATRFNRIFSFQYSCHLANAGATSRCFHLKTNFSAARLYLFLWPDLSFHASKAHPEPTFIHLRRTFFSSFFNRTLFACSSYHFIQALTICFLCHRWPIFSLTPRVQRVSSTDNSQALHTSDITWRSSLWDRLCMWLLIWLMALHVLRTFKRLAFM